MPARSPAILIVVLLFFLVLFSSVTYIAYQRKHVGSMPLDISQIEYIRRMMMK